MSTEIVTITIGENKYEFDPEVFTEYKKTAFEQLKAEAVAKVKFKDEVESLASATKLPKAVVAKYLKARYKDETKKATELAQLYEQLDINIE